MSLKPPPGPPARLDGPLGWVDGLIARLDAWQDRLVPRDLNPLVQSGQTVNWSLLIAVASGILLLIWYSPSIHFAHASLEAIQGRTLGGWVRALHRYSSGLAMLMLAVHAGRVFFARKFGGARWLAWVSGVAMTVLIWFIGWTGYWLVWDQPAQQVAVTSMRFFDALPVFGEPMSRLHVADRLVPSLLFFVVFFLHMLLPLLIIVGLVLHVSRLNRVRFLPSTGLSVLLFIALAIASIVVPAPLDAPAEMAVKAERLTVDAWYLTPLALGLRLSDAGLWLAFGGVLFFSGSIPWVLGRRRSAKPTEPDGPVQTLFQTVVTESRCHACTQCVRDCPYAAVSMVPRTDGKPFPGRAWVDPSLCVGCAVCVGSCDSEAMNLPWFDLRGAENRILTEFRNRRARDENQWVALVSGDIDGGWERFDQELWENRLPGFSVHFVPTASWVRSHLVESLFKLGTKGVLVVADSRVESASRDANQWVVERLAGKRAPAFRPARAGNDGNHLRMVAGFDPSDPGRLSATAEAFRRGGRIPPLHDRWASASNFRMFAASGVLSLLLMAAVVGPSHLAVNNPVNPAPEFVLSFKVYGALETVREVDPEEDAARPVHMRGQVTEKPRRLPVSVRLTVNGETEERVFRAKGIFRDGPAIGEWRREIHPGDQKVEVEIRIGSQEDHLRWSSRFEARERRRHVLTYDPREGFVFEP